MRILSNIKLILIVDVQVMITSDYEAKFCSRSQDLVQNTENISLDPKEHSLINSKRVYRLIFRSAFYCLYVV